MESKHFIPVAKRIGIGLSATALLAVGVACSIASRPEKSLANTESIADNTNLITAGQWSYMPGTKIDTDGLRVEHRDFRIVEQDGSGGQPNPPINLYGTHLRVPSAFTVTARFSDITGVASLQLYGDIPMISDEFRVERRSIRFTFDGERLTVRRWDGGRVADLTQQLPMYTKEFSVPSSSDRVLAIIKNGENVSIKVNDNQFGDIDVSHVFDAGELWFGADAESTNGHFTIQSLEAKSDSGKIMAVDSSQSKPVPKRADGLQELASKRRGDFRIGANVALWAMMNQTVHDRLYGGDFGVLTPENAMKWQFIEPLHGVYDFREADAIVTEARKNGIKIHGHNLVFSEALPRWVQVLPTDTPEQRSYVKKILTDHVSALVGHYKEDINDWDINEIFTNQDNVFYRALGYDYVHVVIDAAYAANPHVRIWLNDHSMENDDESWQEAFVQIKQWKQSGLRIYGFGFQAHIYEPETDAIVDNGQAPTLTRHFDELAGVQVAARISEADAPPEVQREQFTGILRTCITHPNCKEVSFWSVGPTDLWQEDGVLHTTSIDSPFDQMMRPMPSYTAMQEYLRGSR